MAKQNRQSAERAPVRYKLGPGDREKVRTASEVLFDGALREQVTRAVTGSEVFGGGAVVAATVVLGLDEEGEMYLSSVSEGEALPAALVEAVQVALGAGSAKQAAAEPAAAGASPSGSRKRKTRRS